MSGVRSTRAVAQNSLLITNEGKKYFWDFLKKAVFGREIYRLFQKSQFKDLFRS
jgi:hypothetical protein